MTRTHDLPSEFLARRSELGDRTAAQPSITAAEIGGHGGALAKDPLSDVLRMVKLTGALFFVVDAKSPWGVNIPRAETFAPIILPQARHIVSYHIVLEGVGWAKIPGRDPVQFAAGDVIVFPHADAYAMVSAPEQAGEPDTAGALDFFLEMAAGRLPFVVTEGGGGNETAKFVCGFLGCDVRPFNPLLGALPQLLHIKRPGHDQGDLLDKLIELTLAQAEDRRLGGQGIRLGLSELMFVEVVRRYLSALSVGQTGWIAGLRDPGIGRVLALLHENPADHWSVEKLAKEAGMSRSVLAERFADLVGMPPLHYLTSWRMQLAARQLSDGTGKVAAIGRNVGYESEAAFSRGFKKFTGLSPAGWRKAASQLKPPQAHYRLTLATRSVSV
jgi:AraC-like DNA-binding protein